MSQIGWIGLGNMGLAMAGHVQRYLASQGRDGLIFTNRTISRGDDLLKLGAKAASTAGEVVQSSDVVFISVATDAVVRETVESALKLPGGIKGKVICDMSTIHPDTADELSGLLEAAGARFVAAPVFGSTSVAEAGGLVVILGGPSAAIEQILPFCTGVTARATIRVGDRASAASSLKVTGNTILVSLAEIISTAHVLAEKSGVDSASVETLLNLMFNGGPMLNYSQRVTTGGYAPPLDGRPSFGIDLALKDSGHALEMGRKVGAPLPVVEVARQHLLQAREEQGSHLDSTAVYGILRQQAGLPFASDVVVKSGRQMN